jgi:hypothetical protein
MDRMLNRRTFLKTSAVSLPLAAAAHRLQPATISAETIADAAISGTAPKLIPLPARLAAVDPSTLPWEQNIRRVGQSNMTEHDPAVMNIEEWAAYCPILLQSRNYEERQTVSVSFSYIDAPDKQRAADTISCRNTLRDTECDSQVHRRVPHIENYTRAASASEFFLVCKQTVTINKRACRHQLPNCRQCGSNAALKRLGQRTRGVRVEELAGATGLPPRPPA